MPIASLTHDALPATVQSSRELHVGGSYLITRLNAPARKATILDIRRTKLGQEAYVSFENSDKRLDTWVKEGEVGLELSLPNLGGPSNKAVDGEKTVQIEGDVVERKVEPSPSAPSTPEREHAQMTRVRNFEDVRFGEYLIKTWYYSPYPMPVEDKPEQSTPLQSSKKRRLEALNGNAQAPEKSEKPSQPSHKSRGLGEVFSGVGKGGEGARGRLWVCDLCFKYMRSRDGWTRHMATCDMLRPPGRKVYQRGSYTIWEVDGTHSPLYCQNLSLFGKLFIDHKSVFYHVENFLFYVICDASTSKHDQVMAFFSKEKLSYDDFNLACIVTFPPCQNRGFGKLLIEFSYYLTKHPATRYISGSPGTPERPLSDLGLKGYTAYWISTVLRVCRTLLADAPTILPDPNKTPSKPDAKPSRRRNGHTEVVETVDINGTEMTKMLDSSHKGQYAIALSLSDLAKACHLRIDDTAFTLSELGFLCHRRPPVKFEKRLRRKGRSEEEYEEDEGEGEHERREQGGERDGGDLGEWEGVEVVITRGMVDEMWAKWRVKDQGVLEEDCVLL